MKEYFGAATLTAPRKKCELLAEFAFCLYLKGHTLRTHEFYGANTAMRWGAELAEKTINLGHPATNILTEQKPNTEDYQRALDEIGFILCWSPDGAKTTEQCSKRSGRLKTVLEIANLNESEVLNTQKDYLLIEQLREEVLLEHGIYSEQLVESKYNKHISDKAKIVKREWSEVINSENTIALLMKDCTQLSPPFKHSREMYSKLGDSINALVPFEVNPLDRMGKIRLNDKENIAIIHTVRSYGLYSKNYCDYFTIRKALREFGKLHKGKTIVMPFDNAGLFHADTVSIAKFFDQLSEDLSIELNIR
ncbi:hypothetical protein [Vibrio owensii]|uniref:hypothetical protein n=1 Tax=Vibrio owensii TaxID=696485 RepID=UPI0018F206C1|nr:hypothetical protein [Vibrio owensii]